MDLISLLGHLFLDFIIGMGILLLLNKKQTTFHFVIAVLLGYFIETTFCFLVMWGGGASYQGMIVLGVLSIAILFSQIKHLTFSRNKIIRRLLEILKSLKWYEGLLLFFILEKFVFILWQLYRMPTFFSDALKTWSLQGRSIYGDRNFSLQAEMPQFLSARIGAIPDYPLQIPIWRANQAFLSGGWSEFVSRSDGLVFFMIICGIIGCLFHDLLKRRWITLGAIFIIASVPLQVWHGAAGYADIAVEAFLVAAVASFIKREWWLCGVFMAGATWSKNDGFALYLPGILIAGFIYNVLTKEEESKIRFLNMGKFIVGFLLVLPWLIYQALFTSSVVIKTIEPLKGLISYQSMTDTYEVVLTQVGDQFKNSPPSYELFWEYVFTGSTFGIFWMVIFLGLFLLAKQLLFDRMGRSLLSFFIVTCMIIYYIFTYTPAYEYLFIQTTIHRSLLQFSAASLLIIGYGLSLVFNKNKIPIKKVVKASHKKIKKHPIKK